jgi:hypothetical protein
MAVDMYANLEVFQWLATQIMAQHNREQDKNFEFTSIKEGVNEM